MSASVSARPRVYAREIVAVALVLAVVSFLLPGLWAAVEPATLLPALVGGLAIGAASLTARSARGH